MKADVDLLEKRRADFPILSTCTYLISNSLGAMPAGARRRLAEYADLWATRGVLAWDEWMAAVERFCRAIESLINAPSRTVIPLQNVSIAESVLISCLDFSGPRNKIVYSELDFPTIHYNWLAQVPRGARVELVRSADGVSVETEALCDAIDERTLAVPISHVLFRSSFIQDVKPIVEKAHRMGALVFLDVFQSVGSIPVDVSALDVDAAVGGCLKWLCGGPGAAFLYVRPDLIKKLIPTMVGWFAHKRPFDFDMSGLDLADGIWRFAGGTPNVPPLYAAMSGLEIIADVGIAAIRARHKELTTLAIERAQQEGLTINSPFDPEERGGHVTVDFPHSQAAADELIRRKLIVDWRPNAGIRIAPHFYTTRGEVTAVFAELRQIIDGR